MWRRYLEYEIITVQLNSTGERSRLPVHDPKEDSL
jgi:hypothetical protein